MALEESGVLFLKGSGGVPTRSIEYECEGAISGTFDLTTAQGIAESYVGALPVSMTDFYGFETYSYIELESDTDNRSYVVNEDHLKDVSVEILITGMQTGDVMTINITLTLDEVTNGLDAWYYYNINGGSWQSLQYLNSDTHDTPDTIPGVEYGDIVRVRFYGTSTGVGSGLMEYELIDGTLTTGTGEISVGYPAGMVQGLSPEE